MGNPENQVQREERLKREKAAAEAKGAGQKGQEPDLRKVKLRYQGAEIYRGADEHLGISLTCNPGDVVEVSKTKAAELCKDSAWKPYKPHSSARVTASVPGEDGEAASTAGEGGGAMHTGGA